MLALLALGLLSAAPNSLRWNHLGYPPEGRAKIILAASDTNLLGRAWKAVPPGEGAALSGTLGKSTAAGSGQSPWTSHHAIDLSAARTPGLWTVTLDGFDTARILVTKDPWHSLAPLAVRHLTAMRSGPDQGLDWRKASHLGDSSCAVWLPKTPVDSGGWSATTRKVRASGGWYDAGDYIKFTLTTAGTTWFLLRAFEQHPAFHPSLRSKDLPDVLDEARHGLSYLLQLFPDDTTFLIQVGDSRDHNQGNRLPELDLLDGKRPALAALSPAHMSLTAAALALGARTFASLPGQQPFADTCARLSRRIMEKMLPVPRQEFFLRDVTNDFYRDQTLYDNMALGASELFRTTDDSVWLRHAQSWIDSAGQAHWASWGSWNLMAASRLEGYSGADTVLRAELTGFARWSRGLGRPWGIPMQQYWAPFDGYPQVAGHAIQHAALDTSFPRMAWDIWDYMTGRNNWGVSFLMDTANPKAVKNIYSQIYPLSKQPPLGAVAEGPGARTSHEDLVQYFDLPENPAEEVFNTSKVVFFDHSSDFQTMETTIGIQGASIYMLSALSRALAESGTIGITANLPHRTSALKVAGKNLTWSLANSGAGSIRIVGASGKATVLHQGPLAPSGSLSIPASSQPRWAILESGRLRSVVAIAPSFQ